MLFHFILWQSTVLNFYFNLYIIQTILSRNINYPLHVAPILKKLLIPQLTNKLIFIDHSL